MSGRTKALFWLSAVPALCSLGTAIWVRLYASHLAQAGDATYFAIFHLHALPLIVTSAMLLLAGLVSLVFDKRTLEKK